MDLWDTGWGLGAISRHLGMPLGTVRRIANMYDASEAPDKAHATRCLVANAAFLAAVAASGGRFA